MENVFVGTAGFAYKEWMRSFYPEGIERDELLSYYSQNFNSVEINTTFYGMPKEETLKKWKMSVPHEFVFSFKAPKVITHNIELEFESSDLEKFLDDLCSFMGCANKHIILFQLPYSTRQNLANLQKLLELLPSCYRYAFEFRNITWFHNDVYQILKKFNATIVYTDSPVKYNGKAMWPKQDVETSNFCYMRLHGSKVLYESLYSDEEMHFFQEKIKEKVKQGITVFCYFNNTREGNAIQNARALMTDVKTYQNVRI